MTVPGALARSSLQLLYVLAGSRTFGCSRLMTETDDAILGSARPAPYDELVAFNDALLPHSGILTFLMHAFAHEADTP